MPSAIRNSSRVVPAGGRSLAAIRGGSRANESRQDRGDEIQETRPALIIQNDIGNEVTIREPLPKPAEMDRSCLTGPHPAP
jgi:hypothetical protein